MTENLTQRAYVPARIDWLRGGSPWLPRVPMAARLPVSLCVCPGAATHHTGLFPALLPRLQGGCSAFSFLPASFVLEQLLKSFQNWVSFVLIYRPEPITVSWNWETLIALGLVYLLQSWLRSVQFLPSMLVHTEGFSQSKSSVL